MTPAAAESRLVYSPVNCYSVIIRSINKAKH